MIDLAELLSACYRQCAPFAGPFARHLRARLVALLRDWAGQAAAQPELRETGKALFARLLSGGDQELREAVFHLLHDDRELVKSDPQTARFAREVLTTPAG